MKFEHVNYLIDVIMPSLQNANAYAVVSLIARNTWGQKDIEWVELSFSDFMKATGISSVNTVKKAIQVAEQFIEQRPAETQGYIYRMRTMSNIDIVEQSTPSIPAISNSDTPSNIDTVLCQELTPPLSNNDIVLGEDSLKEEEKKEKKEDKPFAFVPLAGKSAVKSPAEERQEAIMEVCGLDDSIPAHVKDAENATAQLKDYSAEYIRERYNPGGWWNLEDWRGKQGQQPTIRQMIETISKKTNPAVHKNGRTAKQPSQMKGGLF